MQTFKKKVMWAAVTSLLKIHMCTIICSYNVWHTMLARMLKQWFSAFYVGGHSLNPTLLYVKSRNGNIVFYNT